MLLVALLVASGMGIDAADEQNFGPFITGLHPISANPDVPMAVVIAGEQVLLDRIDMYERLDREMTQIIYGHSNLFLSIKRANRYFPVIVSILKANGVPEDFAYLAVVESYLSPTARSYAGAVGMWQFMKGTAKQYGLIVNDEVDERYDPVKSTEAACKYLKDAYAKYKHWPTVAASYNAGMGRISSELKKQLADHSFDLWLNEETSRYVFRILAMKEIFSSPAKYGYKLKTRQLYQPIRYTEIRVDTTIENLALFAQEHGVSYAQLKEANPWLRARTMPDKSRRVYYIKIPQKEDLYYTKRKFTAYRKEWVIDKK